MPACLIGLGSNQGNRRENLAAAVSRLAEHPRIELLAQSTWHETSAIGGPVGQPRFLNGALKLETSFAPRELFECLRQIEIQLGRRRDERWGPRTIDLDLLLYDEQVLDTPSLTLPHPRMAWRRFVLEPAAEVAGEMFHPTIRWSIARLLEHLNTSPPYVAVTGGIASGKSHLAERLASALPARSIKERPDWTRLESFYVDPDGQGWATELEFLDQRAGLLRTNAPEKGDSPHLCDDHASMVPAFGPFRQMGTVPFFRHWSVSDFWFDQSAAFARAWLSADRIDDYMERYERLRPTVARPRLIVLLDAPAEELLDRVRGRGRNCERRLTVEQLERIRHEVAEQAGRPELGPVLRFRSDDQEAIFAEVLAAARGTE